ncbi:ABC transporter ATP-binding protein [Luteococcus peritonei]|uniref:ABC transporter ATP-binding protein n=1 Tax=Luteococcus peritonei TaxID=88874 RepID=A0ABW4RW78_9ACTN
MNTAVTPRLPALWRGRRRALLVGLGATGLGQALAAAVVAVATPRLLGVATQRQQLLLAGCLLGCALGTGGLRALERVLGERLGQDYVHEVRMHLVRAALAGHGPSVGVTVARTTNDLTSVRNWLVMGLVPLLVGIPTILGALVALAVLSWPLALAVGLPVAVLGLALVLLAPEVQQRAAALRRRRGRLAGAISDAVHAGEAIQVAGGVEREVRRLGEQSREVGRRAVHRAVTTGLMRGAAASVATIAMVAVAAVGALGQTPAATIATAFLVVGMVATPVTDLGRVSEYRQSYRVAERILAPQVQLSRGHRRQEKVLQRRARLRPVTGDGRGTVHLAQLQVAGRDIPELVARPGEVVVPRSEDPELVRAVVQAVVHPGAGRGAWLQVAGQDLADLPAATRRGLVGHAAAGLVLERGTIARAVRYRCPESTEEVGPVLEAVGLAETVARLQKGERTMLRHGGEPLDGEQRAQLLLARAWYADPALVVLDGIDTALGSRARRRMAEGLTEYPGVTLLVSERADQIAPGHRVWDLDADPARAQLPGPDHLRKVLT